MSYQSVDQLQKVLTQKVFHYAKDAKKAAGRALGTLVEIITFYALKSWVLNKILQSKDRSQSLPTTRLPTMSSTVCIHPSTRP